MSTSGRKNGRTFSLKSLLATLTLMAAAPLVVLGLWFLSSLWEGGRETASRSLVQTADALAVAVEREIAGLTRELRLLGDFPLLDQERLAELRQYAERLVARREGWDRLVLIERDGQVLFDTDRLEVGALPAPWPDHVKSAIESGNPVLSDSYRDVQTDQPAVAIAVPVPRNGVVRWVIDGRLDPGSLSRIIARGLVVSTAALVVDRNLKVVARSADIERHFAESITGQLATALQRTPDHGVGRLDSGAGETLVAWRKIPLGWTIAVSEPAAVRDEPLRRSLARLTGSGAIVLSLGVLLSLVLGQQVANAIATVALDARSLAGGGPVRSRRSMITEISTMFDSLEEAGHILVASGRTREEAIARLKASEEQLILAMEATEAGTLDWNILANMRSASPRARDLFGLPVNAAIRDGQILAAVHPDDLPRVQLALDAAMAGEDSGRLRVDCRVTDREGAIHWLECRGQVRFIRSGKGQVPARVVVVVVDQTERQQRLDDLREADRRKDEFLAMLAHELRNPLAPLRNAISLLGRTVPPDSSEGRAVAMSDRQVRHMTQLVNDLLDVSRITQGKIELRRERLRVADVLQDAIDAVRPMIDERHHALALTLPDPSPEVFADRIRMTQVLENLLSNACKYTDAGGRIGVELEQVAAEVVIRVRDTGIGIAPAQLDHVFELFTQINTAMDRAQGGLGIGLALVRSLVLLHGGTVTAYSEGLGKGACFEVRLPAMSAPPMAKP